MRIARAEAYALGTHGAEYAWTPAVPLPYTATTIVRLIDVDGEEGVGATASYSQEAYDLGALGALDLFMAGVLGRRAAEVESFWRDADPASLPAAHGARSALDIAAWDLAARQAGLPLCRLLGGAVESLPAYASSPFLGEARAYLPAIGEWRELGFRAVKLHGWDEPTRDLELLDTVARGHGGDDIAVMLDAEQGYDRPGALRVAQTMARMSCVWLEAPLPDRDLDGYRDLRRRVPVPILSSGTVLWRPSEVLDALRLEAWDAVRLDVTVAGGITAARKLVALAEAAGLPVEPQSWGHSLIQAANLHLALGCGRASYFEQAMPMHRYETAVVNPIRPDGDGLVRAPDGPGLGVRMDWERVRAQALQRRIWELRTSHA
jgi:L-alanine-DL-glutamate epimerase-like enolase superfamily enzyme